jgi:hypothetical protein
MTKSSVTETTTMHTPGPWTLMEFNSTSYRRQLEVVRDVPNESVAHVCTINEDLINNEAAHNARLIAAAPELLSALKAMVASYDGIRDGLTSNVVLEKLAAADAAIAKAEGGAQ